MSYVVLPLSGAIRFGFRPVGSPSAGPAQHMAAAAASVASATSGVRVRHHLAAAGSAIAAASAALDVISAGFSHLAGTAAAQAIAGGNLEVRHHLAAAMTAISIAGGGLDVRHHLNAAGAALSQSAAALEVFAANIKHLGAGGQGRSSASSSLNTVSTVPDLGPIKPTGPSMSVAIANMALDLLEEEPILTADDDRTAVRWMNRNFGPVRDALLRQHPWNFAIRRASLPQLATPPAFGWSYQYVLPSDCLRILPLTKGYLNGASVPYAIEGRSILTNASAPVSITYVARVVDETDMDPMFVQALAAAVAARAASFMTGKQSYAKFCMDLASQSTLQAQMVDALEGSAPNPEGEDWINGRSGLGQGVYY